MTPITILFIYTFNISGISTMQHTYPTLAECEKDKITKTAALDKLNESENLGYAISCTPDDKE